MLQIQYYLAPRVVELETGNSIEKMSLDDLKWGFLSEIKLIDKVSGAILHFLPEVALIDFTQQIATAKSELFDQGRRKSIVEDMEGTFYLTLERTNSLVSIKDVEAGIEFEVDGELFSECVDEFVRTITTELVITFPGLKGNANFHRLFDSDAKQLG